MVGLRIPGLPSLLCRIHGVYRNQTFYWIRP
jgi:transposase-like protein